MPSTDDLVWLISRSLYRGSSTRRGNEARGLESLAEEDEGPMDHVDPNGEEGDETDRAEARCHAPTGAGCWSSAGTAGGSCCFGCGPATGTACGLTSGPEMGSGPRSRRRSGPDRELLTRGLVGHGRGGHVREYGCSLYKAASKRRRRRATESRPTKSERRPDNGRQRS